MRSTYSHIDLDERRKIARGCIAGLSVEMIAEKLGRHRSTIFRENRRNTYRRYRHAGIEWLLLRDGA
jgi:IS30 family transposase